MEDNKKKEIIRIIKFTLFSISAGIVQIGVFSILLDLLNISYWPSYLIALISSVVWNFTINRKFTFQSANNIKIAMLQVFAFYVVFTPLSTWWGAVLTKMNINEYIVLIGTMLVNFITEFIYDRYFVFGKSIDTAKKEKDEKIEN